MPAGSRKYSGNKLTGLSDLHGSPLSSGSSGSKYSFSIPNASSVRDYSFNANLISDYTNSETESPEVSDQKIFTLQTGLLESEPLIVFTSEFHPLFTSLGRTFHGDALSLKENSRFINAKTSLEVLTQGEDVKKAAGKNRSDIIDYIDTETEFSTKLMNTVNKCLELLDISTYAIPSLRSAENIGSMYEILKKGGYSSTSITNFSQTKLWQQSLIEVKKSLLSSTPELATPGYSRTNVDQDSDPFDLADIEKQPTGQKRIWLSSYFSAPDLSVLTDPTKIDKNVVDLKRFASRIYVNLERTEKSDSSEGSSSRIVDTYSGTGRDVSILSNILFKEYFYSKYLSDRDNVEYLSSKFGYSLRDQNFSVWDSIVGRFSKSVLKTPVNPTGNGNSLASYSRKIVSSGLDSYNVLTFEKNYIENSNSTPGTYYYIDSCLRTSDGKSFDIDRINELISSTNSTYQTVSSLFDMSGLSLFKKSDNVSIESFKRDETPRAFNLNGMSEYMRSVSGIYVKTVKLNPITSDISGIDVSDSSNLAANVPTRLASLICKAAVYPNSVYKTVSETLKSYLFLLVMCIVDAEVRSPSASHWQGDMYVTQTSQENELVIDELRKRIAGLLASVKSSTDPLTVESASKNLRTFPITTGNSLDVVDPRFFDIDTYFGIRTGDGVFYGMAQILKEVYQNTEIFLDEKTRYSGVTRTSYLYAYFDLLLRIVSLQNPEELIGSYVRNFSYTNSATDNQGMKIASNFVEESQTTAQQSQRPGGVVSVTEVGLLVGTVSLDKLNATFDGKLIRKNSSESHRTVRLLSDAATLLKNEEDVLGKQLMVFRRYLFDLSKSLVTYRDFLVKNFESQIKKLSDLYSLDGDLSDTQKNALLNLSFSEEQMILSRYVMSEIKDRSSFSSDSASKIRSLPEFSTIPDGYTDLFPVNETDLVSYPILSSYFKSPQFHSEKGSNKKIISVGIPQKLVKKLRSTARLSRNLKEFLKNGIIRIKIFKVDRLNPHVVYVPKTYLFDTNRFPTRILNNWNYEDLLNGDFNLLNIPHKVCYNNGLVVLDRNFNSSFPRTVYGDYLRQQDKFEIYSNHSISFLCEEYLRWFTDCRFDETRYNNYSQLKRDLENMESQFSSYVNIVRNSAVPASSTSSTIKASYTDPTSGTTFEIPVEKTYSSQVVKPGTPASTKKFVIPMNDTVKMYFQNETFLLDPVVYKKRISYPKKFDRVFNILIDPDDFYVDQSITAEETLRSLVSIGAIRSDDLERQYVSRDKGPGDVTLDEYFVTIEPFDYEMEYV